MVIIGQCYPLERMQEWFRKKGLPKAQMVLKKFPNLDRIFSSFRAYQNRRCTRPTNVVLSYCLPDMWGKLEPEFVEQLRELEEALLTFEIFKWKKSKERELIARLTSDDYTTSLSAATELILANQLAKRVGRNIVELYPELRAGKRSDILDRLGKREVYIEVGNLAESAFEKKLQKILDAAAEQLGNKIGKPCLMEVTIDTTKLVFDSQGYLDEKESVKKLVSEMDRLRIDRLVNAKKVLIDLQDVASALETRGLFKGLEKFMPNYLLKPLDSPARDWIEANKDEIIAGSELIKSIIVAEEENLWVDIETESFFPSEAGNVELNAFINHIKRNIEGQLVKQQLQPDCPNIIVVKGWIWIALVLEEDFAERLCTEIKDFLAQKNERNLSGIAVFGRDFERMVFISNPPVGTASRLDRDEVKLLGISYVD